MNKLEERLYLDIWLIPVLIVYFLKLLDSDFYSAGPALLALLISTILVIGTASIVSSFASDYFKNTTSSTTALIEHSELANNKQIIKLQMYSHIK